MIKYGLKIWSSNINLFDDITNRYKKGEFDFVELYSNSDFAHDYVNLEKLKSVPVMGIHIGNLNSAGFHTFFLRDDQKAAWQMTVELADFFNSPRIIVHPAVEHTKETFWENLEKIDDPRILIESMPVVSPFGGEERKFGTKLTDLREIRKRKEICLDITKFIKACVFHKIDYKSELMLALTELLPVYFHISGCVIDNPIDQHDNMWDANFDMTWVRQILEEYSKDKIIYLVFETPKIADNIDNDIKNIEYFKSI